MSEHTTTDQTPDPHAPGFTGGPTMTTGRAVLPPHERDAARQIGRDAHTAGENRTGAVAFLLPLIRRTDLPTAEGRNAHARALIDACREGWDAAATAHAARDVAEAATDPEPQPRRVCVTGCLLRARDACSTGCILSAAEPTRVVHHTADAATRAEAADTGRITFAADPSVTADDAIPDPADPLDVPDPTTVARHIERARLTADAPTLSAGGVWAAARLMADHYGIPVRSHANIARDAQAANDAARGIPTPADEAAYRAERIKATEAATRDAFDRADAEDSAECGRIHPGACDPFGGVPGAFCLANPFGPKPMPEPEPVEPADDEPLSPLLTVCADLIGTGIGILAGSLADLLADAHEDDDTTEEPDTATGWADGLANALDDLLDVSAAWPPNWEGLKAAKAHARDVIDGWDDARRTLTGRVPSDAVCGDPVCCVADEDPEPAGEPDLGPLARLLAMIDSTRITHDGIKLDVGDLSRMSIDAMRRRGKGRP